MATRILQRIDTLAAWTSVNPVLLKGELGYAVTADGIAHKVGDGTTAWASLPWSGSVPGPQGDPGPIGPQGPQGPKGDTPSIADFQAELDSAVNSAANLVNSAASTAQGIVQTAVAATDYYTKSETTSAINTAIENAELTGVQGPKGDTGATGPAGAAATIAVGTVSVLAEGATPTINNSGTSSAAVFDFGFPAPAGSNIPSVTGHDGEVLSVASGAMAWAKRDRAVPLAEGTVTAGACNYATGYIFSATISGATTISLTNVPATGTAMLMLRLTNGGSAAVTWPSGIKWPGGTAPTLTASGLDEVVLMRTNAGVWSGAVRKDVK